MWELGFGYGAAWSSLIFMFVALVLLICDREAEELYYKERDDVEKSEEDEEDDSSSDDDDDDYDNAGDNSQVQSCWFFLPHFDK